MAAKPKKKSKPQAAKRAKDRVSAELQKPLHVELVAIEDLTADPRNARRHNQQNLDAIKASLSRFGQTKPIVIDADGIVLAGNGTLQAAIALGWKHLSAHRCGLRGAEARAYAIADNRTGELAEWDATELELQMKEIGEQLADFSIESLGWTTEQFESNIEDLRKQLAGGNEPTENPDPGGDPGFTPEQQGGGGRSITDQFKVIFTLPDERTQTDVLDAVDNQQWARLGELLTGCAVKPLSSPGV